jgi:arsenate reductase
VAVDGRPLGKEYTARVYKVIFACVHNAGRSQMAAAIFNGLADRAKAFAISAGTEPGERVHPVVVEAMNELGMDLASAIPQRLTPELRQGATHLVTMGCGDICVLMECGESCPYVSGTTMIEWALPDPKGQPIEKVREVRDEIRRRVSELIAVNHWS